MNLKENVQSILSFLDQNPFIEQISLIGCMAIGSFIIYAVTKSVLLRTLHYLVDKTKNEWDDILVEQKVFQKLAHIAPALFIYHMAPYLYIAETLVERVTAVWIALSIIGMSQRLVDALYLIYRTLPLSKGKSANKSISQLIKVFIFTMGLIIIFSIIIGKSPVVLLSGIGAMTAVLLLIFKDTLLALVASIQISTYKTLRVDDWIEMPEFGADGDVIDISLHTIQVQNWDKTIVNIPTARFLDTSFKNWRGMFQSGGRRIKRSIHIDMTSIQFCDDAMIKRFKAFDHIAEYLIDKEAEIKSYNDTLTSDTQLPANGRKMTNVGTFRAYIKYYLNQKPEINKNLTFLVRQLDPNENGLPIQIYIFIKDTRWVQYEDIQSDIFDHILAVIPEFELRVFQNPTGFDWKQSLN